MNPECPGALHGLAGKRICLVSSGPLGSNPRLVKEADVLVQAGAIVHVVSLNPVGLPQVEDRDQFILARSGWSCTRVGEGGLLVRCITGAFNRACRVLVKWGIQNNPVLLVAHSRMSGHLRRAACATPADLYIAHNLAALPAAHAAASAHCAKLGFDAEDFHSGELQPTSENATTLMLNRRIELRYLASCNYVTAASPGIAEAYAQAYGIPKPSTVLNVFPKAEAPHFPTLRGTESESPSLYWFSQTVGPNRGLEETLEAMALSRSRPTLFLQGTATPVYVQHLRAVATRLGLENSLRFIPPALPGDLVRLTAAYDVGLATEPCSPVNRDMCLSNKVFTYLLAGIPVLASNTTGQSRLARELTGAMFVVSIENSRVFADAIDDLLLAPSTLAEARKIAWQAAQERFNWERESSHFLAKIAYTFGESVVTVDTNQ